MGTYSDSKIVTARAEHQCGACSFTIIKGSRYLRYKLGLRNDVKRCLECASDVTDSPYGKKPVYDCAAVREWLDLTPAIGREG